MPTFSRERARIFRITHIDNIPWIVSHGVHCRSSSVYDPNYRNIGNPELIEKRVNRLVPVAPGGRLSDYVPFYFTSRSPMLLNIKTGQKVPALPMRDVVILVTSLPELAQRQIPFVFTDLHASLLTAQFFSSLNDLNRIDWDILNRSDFQHDPEDPDKKARYQAEALVHRHVPITGLSGIICYEEAQQVHVKQLLFQAGHATPVVAMPNYYF